MRKLQGNISAKSVLPVWCKTGKEILDMGFTEQPMLLETLIPHGAVSALVGSSDTGKSILLLQLAHAIITGQKEFLKFKLNGQHKKVIMLSTEDSDITLSSRLNVFFQSKEEKDCLKNLLSFHTATDVIGKLRELLALDSNVDAIFLDTFADIFDGKDMNQATDVRHFLEPYKELAAAYNIPIVFVHHLAKRTGYYTPAKDSILGSQGFESAMRSVLFLHPDMQSNDTTYLCVVKSNYLSRKDKYYAHKLVSDGLGFTATGEVTAIDELTGARRDKTIDNEKRQLAISLAEEGLSCQKISEELIKKGYKNCGKSAVAIWLKGIPRPSKEKKIVTKKKSGFVPRKRAARKKIVVRKR